MSSIEDDYLEAATRGIVEIKLFWKILQCSQENTFVEKRLQHRCFPAHVSKFLGIPIWKNICERLLLIILLL